MKSTRFSGVDTRSPWIQGLLILIATALYALAFVPVHRMAGGSTAALAALPVALAGALLGLRAGLAAGLAGILLNALLFGLIQEPILGPSELLSSALLVAVGVMAGALRDRLERSRALARVHAALEKETARREEVERELERVRETAEAADRARTEFLSKIGHDVRTPLSVIIGYCELLNEQAWDLGYTDLVPDLDKVLMASQDLLAFVDDILYLSRIERGKIKLYLEAFDLKPLIREVVTEVRPLIEGNGNTLDVRYANDVGAMHADLMKTHLILRNILRNTSRFSRQGFVTLDVGRQIDPDGTEWIRFHVTNTGSGMVPEQRQHVLQALTPAEDASAYQHDAVSLGLTISRHFCQIMGGAIHGEQTADEGLALTVRLPVDVTEHQDERVALTAPKGRDQ